MRLKSAAYSGIILAGGKSSRMGNEKGLVLWKGKPFIHYIIEALKPVVQEIIIVSNHPEYDLFFGKRVEDLIQNAGPLAGLYTGLQYSNTINNLVISCDVPLINTGILELICSIEYREYDIIQCQSKQKIMPLVGSYKKSCAKKCLTLLNNGEKRLMELSRHVETKTIQLEESQEKYVVNINTKEELKMITDEYTA